MQLAYYHDLLLVRWAVNNNVGGNIISLKLLAGLMCAQIPRWLSPLLVLALMLGRALPLSAEQVDGLYNAAVTIA